MSDKKLNMRAYYHTFESTGEMGADRILSAVASAGKSAHHTADWDEEWKNIQSAAVETAGEIAELKQRLAEAESKIPQWIPMSDGRPMFGKKLLIKIKGYIQHEIFEIDQEEDEVNGGGKYFWYRDDLDECPAVNWEYDEWMYLPE